MSLRASFVALCLVMVGCGSTPSQMGAPLTCAELAQCLANCNASKSCEDECTAKGSAAAVQEFQAIVSCDEANACNGESACLDSKCASVIAACVPGPVTDGGMDGGATADGFPASYVGTVIDSSNAGGLVIESIGNATFVRDDSADPRGTSGMFAFYRLKTITYVSKASGGSAGCTYAANETVTFNDPPAFENLVAIEKKPNGGAYTYDITTTLSVKRPKAMTIVCPGGASTADFNAENNVAAGIPAPTTTSLSQLKAMVNAPGQTRGWSWDLQGK